MRERIVRLLNLQPGEERKTFLLYSLHIIFYVGLAWGDAVSISLFMDNWGSDAYRYILIGDSLLAFVLGLVYASFADRVSNANLLIIFSVILGTCLSAIRLVLGAGASSTSLIYPLLLLLFRLSRRLLALQILNYINDFYDTRAAKRALPLMASAVGAGTALGGIVIGPMINLLGVENVVLGWAVCLMAVIVLVLVCERQLGRERRKQLDLGRAVSEPGARRASPLDDLRSGFRFVKSSRFLMFLAGATLCMAFINNMFTFQASWAVNQAYPDAADQTAFYGILNSITSSLTLLIQVLLLGRLINWVGVSVTHLIFPFSSLLLYGFLGLRPHLVSAIGGRFNNSTIKEGFRTPTEAMLYNSVPVQVKGRAKAFINGLLVPISVLVAGGLLFFVPSGQALPQGLVVLAIAVMIAYIVLTLGLRREYGKALVRMLEEEDFTLYRLAMAEMDIPDARTFEQLVHRLESSTDDDFSIFLAEVAAQVGGARSLPVLHKLATTGTPRVRSAVLDILSEADFAGAEVRELCVDRLDDESSAVRRAAIVALERLVGSDDEEFLAYALKLLDDSALDVHVQVLPPLIKSGDFFYLAAAVEALSRLLKSQDGDRRTVGVYILGSLDDVRFLRTLIVYLRDSSDAVRRQASVAMEHLTAFDVPDSIAPLVLIAAQRMLRDSIEYVRLAGVTTLKQLGMDQRTGPALVTSLSDKSYRVRQRAITALQGMGEVVVPALEKALKRPNLKPDAKEIFSIVLARIDRERFEPQVNEHIEHNLLQGSKVLSTLAVLESLPVCSGVFILNETLQEMNARRVERLFDLIASIRPPESVQIIVDHLHSLLPRVQANAIEALESLTSPRTAQIIAALARVQTETLATLVEDEAVTPSQVLEEYSRSDDPWLRAATIYALGQVGLECFSQDQLERIIDRCRKESADKDVQEACQFAWAQLHAQEVVQGKDGNMLSTIERVIFLKQVHFFENMTIEQLRIIAGVSEERTVARDEIIFSEGDVGDTLHIVVRGSVGIERRGKHAGSVVRLASLSSGQYFGEMSIFDEQPRSATAISLDLSLLLSLRRAPLMALIQENPAMSLELIRVLSRRLRESNVRLTAASKSRPRVLERLFDDLSETGDLGPLT